MIIFRSFFKGVKNLIIWFPIIWKDRQWDYCFLFDMLHKKLSLMEKFFREKGIHVDHEKDADNIKFAILVMNRIMKDEYYTNAFLPYRRKYGESHFNWIDKNNGTCELDITLDKQPVTEKEIEQEKHLFRKYSSHEDHLKKQDLSIFFNHLRRYILTWWD